MHSSKMRSDPCSGCYKMSVPFGSLLGSLYQKGGLCQGNLCQEGGVSLRKRGLCQEEGFLSKERMKIPCEQNDTRF